MTNKPATPAFKATLTFNLDGPGGNVFAVIGDVKGACKALLWAREDINDLTSYLIASSTYEEVFNRIGEYFEVKYM